MIGRIACLVILVASAVSPSATAKTTAAPPIQAATLQEHVAWVADSLKRMQSIKPGMTRADLLKLFGEDGGLQTGRIFVFSDCPYFKVSVEWEPTGRVPTGTTLAERMAFIDGLPSDVIKSISKPYVEAMKID